MSESAAWEACGVNKLSSQGTRWEGLRALIGVPPRIGGAMRAYARVFAEEASMVNRALMFKQAVAREFERLVREGAPIAELPEVEEAESAADEEALVGTEP